MISLARVSKVFHSKSFSRSSSPARFARLQGWEGGSEYEFEDSVPEKWWANTWPLGPPWDHQLPNQVTVNDDVAGAAIAEDEADKAAAALMAAAEADEADLDDVALFEMYDDPIEVMVEGVVVDQSEMECSGEPLIVPDGYVRIDCPDKLTVNLLKKAVIMFDWDSGWEVGEVMAVKGRSATSKECIVQFEGGAASDKRKVTLAKAEYGKRWVFLKEDEASPTIALPGPA